MVVGRAKFAIETLGCKVNQYESQVLREDLSRRGFRESAAEEADVCIVNSCTVTGRADLKTRKLIRKIKKGNPRASVYVTGCYAVLEEDMERLRAMPEVDEVVPGKDKMSLPGMLDPVYGGRGGDIPAEEKVSGFSSMPVTVPTRTPG